MKPQTRQNMRNLYYVVENQYQDVGDGIKELTGWKTITTYTVENNLVNEFFDVECSIVDTSTEVILEYLNDNGYTDEINFFKLTKL
jgi:hypothetical protein